MRILYILFISLILSTVCDYFIVENGGNGTRYFKFKNTGDTPLEVFAAVSDSKNITATCPTKPIKPGEVNYMLLLMTQKKPETSPTI